jgi:integrase
LNTEGVAIEEALDSYKTYMIHEKGNKTASAKQTRRKLGGFFPSELKLGEVTPKLAQSIYDAYRTRKKKNGKPIAVDHHRNLLAEAKTFMNWCVAKKYIKANPFTDVRGVGRRRKGKRQLTRDESRKFLAVAIAQANTGREMAIAAMVALLLGERASEVLHRQVRDLDDGGRLLIISDTKTDAGRRTLEVPAVLQPYLLKLASGKEPTESLFNARTPRWLLRVVKQICTEAGVPEVCTHALRGTHSTLATEHGVTGHVVAASLGHESVTTTYGNYTDPSAVANAKNRRVVAELGRAA